MTYCKKEEFESKKSDSAGRTKKSLSEYLLFKDSDDVINKRVHEYNKAIKDGRYDRETRSITLK